MYIDLGRQSGLQPFVSSDWRLVAERGLRCFGHMHSPASDCKTVAACEIGFLLEARRATTPLDELNLGPPEQQSN